MKKAIFLMLACVSVLLTSCETDYSIPNNLVGTIWKCTYDNASNGLEYDLLIFTSKSTVEGRSKYANQTEKSMFVGSFSILRSHIFVSSTDYVFDGEIIGDEMVIEMGNDICTFKKQ